MTSQSSVVADAVEVTMFERPSGNVRGIVIASFSSKGKAKRVAHATLLTDAEPSIRLDVPREAPLGDIPAIASVLNEFAAKVRVLAAV